MKILAEFTNKTPTLSPLALVHPIAITYVNQVGAFKFEQGVLEQPLVLRVEPRSLRRHLVHDSHVRYQIVVQQIFHEITSDETASCANAIRVSQSPFYRRSSAPPHCTCVRVYIYVYKIEKYLTS